MHIAFAISFFFMVGLGQVLNQGILGLNPAESAIVIHILLFVAAVLVLRGDLMWVFSRPTLPLYGDERLGWTWGRTALGLATAALIWTLLVLYGPPAILVAFRATPPEELVAALVVQVATVAVAQELFFREALLKSFAASIPAAFLACALAGFTFHLTAGVNAALIAAGCGIVFLSLRLCGVNILAVATISGATALALRDFVLPAVGGADTLVFSMFFFAVAAMVSMLIHAAAARRKREFIYA